jgi:DNA-binding NtrC family response regulator
MSTELQTEFMAEVFQGCSAPAARLRLQVARFAPHFRTVLLVGEPGAGKRAVVAELHRMSPAAAEPLIERDASDVLQQQTPPGGVLYMPGLESIRVSVQEEVFANLKAVARETRVVVGCSSDPRGLVASGKLRPELLERLGVLEIRVPALRERPNDVLPIASAMLLRLRSQQTLMPAQCDALQARQWTNNLASLWQVCMTFASTGGLPDDIVGPTLAEAPLLLDEVLQRHVRTVIERCAGNKLKAAELLGISRSTLYRMLETAASQPEV